MMLQKIQKLSGFWLKLIAIITMTLDHIGMFMLSYSTLGETLNTIGYVFRCIGRLSLPLFIFLLIEGIYHTRNKWKYLLRLSILLVSIMVVQIIIFYAYDQNIGENPFIDLVIIALFFMLIREKGYKKLLAILPFAYMVLCTSVQIFETWNDATIEWLPTYLRMGYSLFAFLLALGFYFAYPLAKLMSKNTLETLNIDMEDFTKLPYFRSIVNILGVATILIVNVIFYLGGTISVGGIRVLDYLNIDIQSWSIFALLFILCYNGLRGYNAKWFKYGSYMYFPLHLIILFVIFQLVFVGYLF